MLKNDKKLLDAITEAIQEKKGSDIVIADFSKMNDNVDLAGRFVYNENKVPTVNFGKYKGESVFNVFAKDPAYYDWMQRGDFPQETKHVLTRLLLEFKEAQKTK